MGRGSFILPFSSSPLHSSTQYIINPTSSWAALYFHSHPPPYTVHNISLTIHHGQLYTSILIISPNQYISLTRHHPGQLYNFIPFKCNQQYFSRFSNLRHGSNFFNSGLRTLNLIRPVFKSSLPLGSFCIIHLAIITSLLIPYLHSNHVFWNIYYFIIY